jgi:hypothetical protein
MTMVTSSVEDVLRALEEQLGCYRALAKLAARQHEHVLSEQTEQLLDVLKEREGVLDRVAALEKITAPVKRDWNGFAGRLAGSQRKKVEGMLIECKALLAEITAGDERDALALQQRKHRIGNEIKQSAAAVTVNRNYAASAYGRNSGGGMGEGLKG